LAGRTDWFTGPGRRLDVFAADPAILLDEIGHGVVDAFQPHARDLHASRFLRASAVQHRVVLVEKLPDGLVDADIDTAMELDALPAHLHDPAVDMMFFDLEIRNPVSHQPAGPAFPLVDMH